MKIIADKGIPFVKEYLPADFAVEYLSSEEITKPALKGADAVLIRSVTKCDATLLEGTGVRLIVSATIGDDHIDKDFCRRHNIVWKTASGCNKQAVVQYVIWVLYYLQSRFGYAWKSKTTGIIGVGNIGGLLSKTLARLGVKHLLHDPPRQQEGTSGSFVSLEKIRQEADVVSLHVPLTRKGKYPTFHLLGDDFFAHRKKEITLINSSRGAVLSTEVLKRWKERGVIEHLILDVWENEPEIDRQLLSMTTLGTPHIAGYSLRGKMNASYMSLRHIESFFHIPMPGLASMFVQIAPQPLSYRCGKGANTYGILEQIWDIEKDSQVLKERPQHFKQFRDNYKLRPQIQDVELRLENCNPDITNDIRRLAALI